jgi:DNA-binding NarL/FixJ family response regulator
MRGRSRDHRKGGWAVPIPTKTRVLLADDHGIVRRGIRLVLDAEPDIEVVAEAADGAEAVNLAAKEDIQLAVLDVAMPRLTGLQAAREISRRRPDVRILMLSMYDNEEYLFEALKAGASGYVLKSGADQDLVRACRAAMRGEAFLYPKAITALIRAHLERTKGESTPVRYLPRENLRSSNSSPRAAPPKKSPTSSSSAPRPSSDTGRTSWRSSRCETGSNSPDTPYGEASSSPESSPRSCPAGCARTAVVQPRSGAESSVTRQAAEMGGTTDTAGRRVPARMVLRRAMAPA